jgi:cobalt-zinc-cadmium efflux system outer membrane protein
MYFPNRRHPLRTRSWSFAENKKRGLRDTLVPPFLVASAATKSRTLYKMTGPLHRTVHSSKSMPFSPQLCSRRTETVRSCNKPQGGFKRRFISRLCLGLFATAILAESAFAQGALTWQQIRDKFETSNPTLLADRLNIDESKAEEITAFLRPNPEASVSADGTQVTRMNGVWQPLKGTTITPGVSYLHERDGKRELRLKSQQEATGIAVSTHADLERSLLFNLRGTFVATLQAKAVAQLAKDNLAYYDQVLQISRDRFNAGGMAQIDLDRLELQRVQYESDVETADVNLRTAKIQLLTLLNDRTPIEQFDVTGPYDFNDQLMPRDEFRQIALDTRPDLMAAVESIVEAQTTHKLAVANGSTDPTLSAWFTHNGSWNNPNAINTIGASISIPLRVFDRNQGEKLRTQLDITRNQRVRDAAEAQVLSDVDSGYAILDSTLILLRPYKAKYLQQSVRVRDTVTYAYQRGGASLLDFLNAQADYRAVQLNYVNLLGSYLTAAAQLNMAVGREAIQ